MSFGVVVLGSDEDRELDVHDAGLREVEPVEMGVGDCQRRHAGVDYEVAHEHADAGDDDGEGDEDADDGGAPDQRVGFLAGTND